MTEWAYDEDVAPLLGIPVPRVRLEVCGRKLRWRWAADGTFRLELHRTAIEILRSLPLS